MIGSNVKIRHASAHQLREAPANPIGLLGHLSLSLITETWKPRSLDK
jgi:hypothetical protein